MDDAPKPKRPGGRGKKVRNPGSGKAPSNAPARGAGWGGPAKGFVPNTNGKAVLTVQTMAAGCERGADGKMQPSIRGLDDAALKEELQSLWLDISRNESEFTPNRIVASDKLYVARFGKPGGDDDKATGGTLLELIREAIRRRNDQEAITIEAKRE